MSCSTEKSYHFLNNANRIIRLIGKFGSYHKVLKHMRNEKVPFSDLLRIYFPYLLPSALKPPIITLEFTNVCNMRCVYCPSTTDLRKKGYMAKDTLT